MSNFITVYQSNNRAYGIEVYDNGIRFQSFDGNHTVIPNEDIASFKRGILTALGEVQDLLFERESAELEND